MPGDAPHHLLLRQHLLACALTALYLLAWTALARGQGHPFALLADSPIAATEQALLEVQRHPEEGIHALARVKLPPYTGILHLTHAGLWCAAAALALLLRRRPLARAALFLFPLLMAQEGFLLISERLGHERLFDLLYLAAYLVALLTTRAAASGNFSALLAIAPWLLLRATADLLLPTPEAAQVLEAFTDLTLPLLYCLALAQSPQAPRQPTPSP